MNCAPIHSDCFSRTPQLRGKMGRKKPATGENLPHKFVMVPVEVLGCSVP